MEHIETNLTPALVTPTQDSYYTLESQSKPFIEANTISSSLEEMRNDHIIPVFVKDNEPLISHLEFIESTQDIVADLFRGETILKPSIRVSHPVKGRIPEAKHKPADQLYPWEKTLYYERMMFAIEIPSIKSEIDGNMVSLTIGGVKAYNQDNLYSRMQTDQNFKLFMGFQNKVCTNLCVWSDGLVEEMKVRKLSQLKSTIQGELVHFNPNHLLGRLSKLPEFRLTELEFATLVGKCRMYPYLSAEHKQQVPALNFGDQQLGAVVRDYYKNPNFCKENDSSINLWRLYNLFTGANKTSYIDSFLSRSVNALELVENLRIEKEGGHSWYLN